MSPVLVCLLLSVGYVVPFYMLPTSQGRNHPSVVKARMACTLAYCCLAWLPLRLFLWTQDSASFMRQLGIKRDGLLPALLLPLLLTATLFAGPIALRLALWLRSSPRRGPGKPQWSHLRDLVVAPLTEEFVFRALLLLVLTHAGYSSKMAVLIAPLFFGIAHLHHLHHFLRYEGFAIGQAVPAVAFQFLYTTVFGWYVAWLFLRTGHMGAAVLPHCFCNFMGVPDFSKIGNCGAPRLVLCAFSLGIAAFWLLMEPLGSPRLYGGLQS